MKKRIYQLLMHIGLIFSKLLYHILGVDRIYKSHLYKNPEDIPADVPYCLILGAMLFSDDSLPPILVERLEAAIALYQQRPDLIFLLSGDGSKQVSNDVQAMYHYLKYRGHIPDSQLRLDNKGFTTYDSLLNIPEEVNEAGFILLTSAFHMPRSVYFCHRLHKNAYPLHLEPTTQVEGTYVWQRELLALNKYVLNRLLGFPGFHDFWHVLWFRICLLIGKFLSVLLRLFRRNATTYPGRIALELCPYLFQYLTEHISLILVTGTNGKTSTCRRLESILKKQQISCISNRSGANLRFGLATTLLTACSFRGRYKVSYAVLECDEGDFAKIASQLKSPDITILVTNLFRDQLDRYGELERTRNYVRSAIENIPTARLCLNADCVLTASLAHGLSQPVCFYGLAAFPEKESYTSTEEALFCPVCGGKYAFTAHSYGHLGEYHCPHCQSRRPAPTVSLSLSNGDLTVHTPSETFPKLETNYGASIYQLYNSLSAAAVLYELKLSAGIPDCFRLDYSNPGRQELFETEKGCFSLTLVKNPAGLQQQLNELREKDTKNFIFALSDAISDGRDVSWIWDCDLSPLCEQLSSDSFLSCCGSRCADMAVRLKYADIPQASIRVDTDFTHLYETLPKDWQPVQIFSTYSNLAPIQDVLQKERLPKSHP